MNLLFSPDCIRPVKRFRDNDYENSICELTIISRRKRRGMLFSAQQAADIAASNSKVSADGPINTHSDVETITPNVGDILVWNGSVWTNTENDTGITSQQIADITTNNAKISADGPINTHSDVETTTPRIGDILAWDGTNWVNIPASVGISVEQAADIISNCAKISADGPINTHSDVEVTTPMVGDVLSWNGSNWTNVP